jgi:hypothetical protein
MAINSVVETDSITVFGPPETIEVSLDIGATGERGSLIYSGSGDPNLNTGVFINEQPKLSDLYLRTDTGADYGLIYQYNAVPGGNEWQSILKIIPILYSTIEEVEFISGSASVTIPLSNIYEDAPSSLTANNFSVQLTPEYSEAVALSISTKGLTTGESKSLVIGMRAKSGTTDLNDTINVNMLITVVI